MKIIATLIRIFNYRKKSESKASHIVKQIAFDGNYINPLSNAISIAQRRQFDNYCAIIRMDNDIRSLTKKVAELTAEHEEIESLLQRISSPGTCASNAKDISRLIQICAIK